MHWIYLIHEFHNLSWITEINELFHDILIYWDAPVHYITGTHYTSTWFLLPSSTIDDTQLYHSFQPDNPIVAAWISGCLANISPWMKEHHLQLNLAKTEKLLFGGQLTFKDHIVKTAWSCRFALHNIRRIRPFQTEHAVQLLAQALVISRLDYCNALLAGLPSCANKPRQMFQNAVARLVFHEPKRAHFTPLFISLHWLPVAARIKFKTLMFAYRIATGSAPSYESTSPPEAWDL